MRTCEASSFSLQIRFFFPAPVFLRISSVSSVSDHATGKGYVAGRVGQYADALREGSRVISAIVETFGGITPHFLSVRYWKQCAAGAVAGS